MTGLPAGWMMTTIGKIAKSVNPGFPSGAHNQEGKGRPHLRPMNISSKGEVDLSQVKYVDMEGVDCLTAGDVLFNNTNSPALVGKTAYIKQETDWAYSNHMTRIRLVSEKAEPAWVAHYLHYLFLNGFFLANCRHHVNQASIATSFLTEKVLVPLPPLAIQQQIVAEIEKQFSRVAAGTSSLLQTQANLRRYRAAVLRAACEGRLVPQDPNDEAAPVLLRRILAERRAQWEAEHPGKKYVEPEGPDAAGLPGLPAGWHWASLEQVSERIVDCLHSTPVFQEKGRLCVDANCIEPGRILVEHGRYVDERTYVERNRRMTPQARDVIFSREGALLGIAVCVPEDLPFCLGQRMMIFRPSGCLLGEYLEKVLNSSIFRSQYRPLITGTAAPHVNIGELRPLVVPLPPLQEQHRIVTEVERTLSVIRALEKSADTSLVRADRLRQAVLKRAFEGRICS